MKCNVECEFFEQKENGRIKSCKNHMEQMDQECLLRHLTWTMMSQSATQEQHLTWAKKMQSKLSRFMRKAEDDIDEGEDWKKG